MKAKAQSEIDSFKTTVEYLIQADPKNRHDHEEFRTILNLLLEKFRKVIILLEFNYGHAEVRNILGDLPPELVRQIGRKSVSHPRTAKIIP